MIGSEWVCIQALLSRNEKERRDMMKFVSGERNIIIIDSNNIYDNILIVTELKRDKQF